jgi:hypothetical protein
MFTTTFPAGARMTIGKNDTWVHASDCATDMLTKLNGNLLIESTVQEVAQRRTMRIRSEKNPTPRSCDADHTSITHVRESK